MSQQGARRGHEDDWWRELYDEEKPDTGPAGAADSLDDRFDSASRAVASAGRSSPGGSPPGGSPPGRTAPDLPQRAAEEGEWWQSAPPTLDSSPPGPAPEEWPEPTWPPRGRPAPRPPAPRPPVPGDGRSGLDPEPGADRAPAEEPTPAPRSVPRARAPWEAPPAPGERNDDPRTLPRDDNGPGPGDADPGRTGGVVSDGPRPPAEAEFVGRRAPTYEAEPIALPLADPDGIGDLAPDTVLDGARYGSLVLRAASLRGDSGRYRGEPRRDALVTARFGTGDGALLLVAVACGARAAGHGARRAAAEICRWVGTAAGHSHARLAEDIRAGRRGALKSGLHRLTDRAYGRLRARATELGLDPAEYTAALRCLLLPADPACRTRVFFGVGGGGLFRLRDGVWQDLEPAATEPGGGAPVVGYGAAPPAADLQTADRHTGDAPTVGLGVRSPGAPEAPAAPSSAAAQSPEPSPEPPAEPFLFRASVARPGDTLLLCSAGLAEPLRDEPELAGILAGRWACAAPPGLAAFLADVQLRVTGYADDRTAAAVWEA
ncbi:protein phosphatase 2C domain-containing protein [Streptomyces sp. 7N604]|uniref:protein phosphatase 2C domain-containing protein n=1 Tax=Streptomyces sp. 7N604 TaxID=3457415 RepID=UPI003FD28B36